MFAIISGSRLTAITGEENKTKTEDEGDQKGGEKISE